MKLSRLHLPSVTSDTNSWLSSLMPVFGILFVLVLVGIRACIPSAALDRATEEHSVPRLDAVPSGKNVIWGAYPGQVQNYRQHTAQLCDGDVFFSPSSGLPSSVTIVVSPQVRTAREKKRAKFAWLRCIEMRRNYLDTARASRCEVRMIDTRGHLVAFVSQATVRQDLHCADDPETLLSHSQTAMTAFLTR